MITPMDLNDVWVNTHSSMIFLAIGIILTQAIYLVRAQLIIKNAGWLHIKRHKQPGWVNAKRFLLLSIIIWAILIWITLNIRVA